MVRVDLYDPAGEIVMGNLFVVRDRNDFSTRAIIGPNDPAGQYCVLVAYGDQTAETTFTADL